MLVYKLEFFNQTNEGLMAMKMTPKQMEKRLKELEPV